MYNNKVLTQVPQSVYHDTLSPQVKYYDPLSRIFSCYFNHTNLFTFALIIK